MERRAVTGHRHGSGQLTGFNDTRITCSFNYIVPAPRITGSLAHGDAGSRCRVSMGLEFVEVAPHPQS